MPETPLKSQNAGFSNVEPTLVIHVSPEYHFPMSSPKKTAKGKREPYKIREQSGFVLREAPGAATLETAAEEVHLLSHESGADAEWQNSIARSAARSGRRGTHRTFC
jgi:hypothetical protein